MWKIFAVEFSPISSLVTWRRQCRSRCRASKANNRVAAWLVRYTVSHGVPPQKPNSFDVFVACMTKLRSSQNHIRIDILSVPMNRETIICKKFVERSQFLLVIFCWLDNNGTYSSVRSYPRKDCRNLLIIRQSERGSGYKKLTTA